MQITNTEYARQIARDWNTRDEKSGFAGFVTGFSIDNEYLAKFEPCVVGASHHQEYWVPSAELSSLNKAIVDRISVEEAFFGAGDKQTPAKVCAVGNAIRHAAYIMEMIDRKWLDSAARP